MALRMDLTQAQSMQLSLFDLLPPPSSLRRPQPAMSPLAPAPVTPEQAPPAPPRQARSPVPPAPPPSAVSSALRRVHTPAGEICYTLRRARRRTMGLTVGPQGVSVAASRWVGLREIDAFVIDKAAWVQRKLAEVRERQQHLAAARIAWSAGGEVPFLGQTLVLALDARTTGAQVCPAPQAGMAGELRLGLPPEASAAQIREAVECWWQRQARRLFAERCAHFAPLLGVAVRRIALSSAQTRWGSASADGSVRLNWRLVLLAPPLIDYVVVHELAHLREMNHSPAFWAIVGSVLPQWRDLRLQLREAVVPHGEVEVGA